mmetsp:Transcript_30834/g.68300  ORF Transcript_30834/g.68300 Transcript_30834/m.68300 type:complete len:303 (+) Transcript_30834:91-999(+)
MARYVKKWLTATRELFADLLLFIIFVRDSIAEFLFKSTHPLTRRLFSRLPTPPRVTVKDVRANRIRLNIESSYSSSFNVEVFEIEWKPTNSEVWQSTGTSNLQQRTIARLAADTNYVFRVRAKNEKGESNWCPAVSAKTRQEPVSGGGHGPGYTWTQTPTDVTITFEVPAGTSKKDTVLVLKSSHLKVEVHKKPADCTQWNPVLLDGELYGKVVGWDNGSYWELVKEGNKTLLILTLEKSSKSMAPKFDYWRSIQPGTPDLEIDTHKLSSGEEEGTGLQMMQPGSMDPEQLRAMGLGQYARM